VLSTSHLILPPSFPRSASCASPISTTRVSLALSTWHTTKFSVNTGGEKLFQTVFGLTNHTHTPHSAKNYSPNLNASADLAFGKLGQGPARPLRWRSITPTATQHAAKINIPPTLHRDIFPHAFQLELSHFHHTNNQLHLRCVTCFVLR
jgi:hypothetical protein